MHQGKNSKNKQYANISRSKKHKNSDSIKLQETPIKIYKKGGIIRNKENLINIALVYPNTYHVGMSNLGFQSVYGLFNSDSRVLCQRFFMLNSYQNCSNINKKNSNNAQYSNISNKEFEIRSFETGLSLTSFDLIAFSVSFENDYINIVSILQNSGIPLRTSHRDPSRHPFIIAGGIACFLNPEPIAPFIDCFLLGEAEEMVPSFLDIFISFFINKNQIRKRNNFSSNQNSNNFTIDLHTDIKRETALNIKGSYVPEFYQPFYDINGSFSSMLPIYDDIPAKISVQHIDDLSKTSTTTQILTNKTTFENTLLIEIGRGCHHGCRFCSAGFIYRPSRFYPEKTIIDEINQASLITDKIGLVSPTISDHPHINKICDVGIHNKLKIGFSSLRLDALTDTTIEKLVKSSVKTATIAPEAGSQRMRNIINKKISEKQILSSVKRLVEHGIINLKLYFMVGLPFEIEDDISNIVTLTEKIKDVFLEASKKNKKIGNITLSINPFIPKPNTPFQWCAMDSISNFKRKIDTIKTGLKKTANVSIQAESAKTAIINGILSRGDRRMADILEKQKTEFFLKNNSGVSEIFLKEIFNQIAIDSPLPWDIVDNGIKKEFLIKELKRAELEKTSPDCPMLDCSSCRLCKIP